MECLGTTVPFTNPSSEAVVESTCTDPADCASVKMFSIKKRLFLF